MDTNRPLILLGGGGHCKSVIDVAECAGYTILGILDRSEEVGKRVLGYSSNESSTSSLHWPLWLSSGFSCRPLQNGCISWAAADARPISPSLHPSSDLAVRGEAGNFRLAQCHGRNTIFWHDKSNPDVWYVDYLSISADVKEVFLTIKFVIIRDGIFVDVQATISPFIGNN